VKKTASCKEGQAGFYEQEAKAGLKHAGVRSAVEVPAGFSVPAAHHRCTAAPSARSLNWVLHKRAKGRVGGARTHAHTLSKWQVQRVMKKGSRAALSTLTKCHSLGKTAGAPAPLGSLDSVALCLSQQLSAMQGHTSKHRSCSTLKSQASCPPQLGFALIKATTAA